ncbi:MAG TPA: sensor histidine kinase [Nocardioides sp.]|nr:sensor histidine kinase [Nocardioides sp.]
MTTVPECADPSAHPGAVSGGFLSWGSLASATVAVLAAAAALVVVTAGDAWGMGPAPQVLVDAVVGLTYAPIGAVVLHGRSLDRGTRSLAWVLLGSGLASALAAFTTAVALTAPQGPLLPHLVQLQSWLWVPGFVPLLTLVPLLYPSGLLPGTRWRLAFVASCAGMVLLGVGAALYPDEFPGRVPIEKPVTTLALAQGLTLVAAIILLPSAVAAFAGLFLRLRRSTGLRRRQVAVLLVAVGLLGLVTALQGVVPSPADLAAQALAVALVPVAIGVAVTRHRLYELDTALCRALVAASLTVCLAGVYLTTFAVVRTVAPDGIGTALAAGVTGVLVLPLARRLSEGVDRMFYGDRADPYSVSTRLSSRLSRSGLDVAEIPQTVCDAVVEALRLGSASVLVSLEDSERELAASGASAGTAERFALRHRGDLVGWLAVTPRPGEVRVDPRDAEILAVIADQAAPALAALQLHEQLQRSRESLVAAREEERLRLRRELHDGLGATLAGLRLQVESAQALVSDGPAVRLLDHADSGVAQAVAEVRSITDDLRPPAIDELGLARALTLLAERLGSDRCAVEVEICDLPTVTPAVEVAAYRIASEALANAVRHSGAGRVRLEVGRDGTSLHIRVTDDGAGLRRPSGAASGSGIGLASMQERAEEIGGSFELTEAPGGRGTVVRAALPLTTTRGAR